MFETTTYYLIVQLKDGREYRRAELKRVNNGRIQGAAPDYVRSQLSDQVNAGLVNGSFVDDSVVTHWGVVETECRANL